MLIGALRKQSTDMTDADRAKSPIGGEAHQLPAATATTGSFRRLTSDLSNLDQEPSERGAIDSFTDGVLRGWAVSAANPLRPVKLELWLAGVRVTNFVAGEPRPDVSELIGLPIRAGFVFDLAKVTRSNARDVLARLRQLQDPAVWPQDLISVRIEGTDLELPIWEGMLDAKTEIAPLVARLVPQAEVTAGQQRAAVRDLLASHNLEPAGHSDASVRVVAYYLPQFHPFAQNNEWWGTGFTEWTNVTSAKPFYKDHYQPHLPADLGFYDLRLDQVQRDQIALAKLYGVSAFCYYYYWFSGETLMTLPLDRHVEQDLDMDFCLCWANESWSRRWDGSESDVLIGQRHVYDSDVEFIRSCLPYFRSKRYIKIDGAPVLQVYRISLLERPVETLERWREIVRAEGFPNLHVTMVESFGLVDPLEFGCDSSCQFPPHGVVGDRINPEIEELAPGFTGTIYSYGEIVRGEIARPAAAHTRFRAAMPSWDNTARKGRAGNVFAGATPALFETWMRCLVADARQRLPEGERFVFVNAWNEWAEGTHLEPDRKHGHANLRAVRNALAPESLALAPLLAPADGAADDPMAETRRYVAGLIAANRELTRLVSQPRFGMRLGEGAAFVSVPLSLLKVKPAATAHCNLDTVNGRPFGRGAAIPMKASQGLFLKGWLVCPETSSSALLVGLRSKSGPLEGQFYVAAIDVREPRPDVVEAFGLDNSSLNTGFSVRASLQDVKPGEYEIEFISPDVSSATSGLVVPAGFAILVG